MSKKDNLIDLYDYFREKKSDSIVRHINNGVRVDNQSWSKKKRQEYDDRRKENLQ